MLTGRSLTNARLRALDPITRRRMSWRVLGEVVPARQRHGRVIGIERKRRAHRSLVRTLAHHAGVAAPAERKAERIEKNRFSGARLSGQHRQAGVEFEVQMLNNDDIAD